MKNNDPDLEKVLAGQNKGQLFLFFIYQMTIAYFSSKVINPYRKCNLYKDIQREFMNSTTSGVRKKVIATAIDCIDADESKDQHIQEIAKGKTHYHLYQASRLVGYFLGDLLYDNFYSKKSSKLPKLLKVLLECPLDEKSFDQFKWKILPRTDYKNYKKRFF